MRMKLGLIGIQNVLNIQEHSSYGFQWLVLPIAPKITFMQKILEAVFIKKKIPSLNSQMNNDLLILSRNDET